MFLMTEEITELWERFFLTNDENETITIVKGKPIMTAENVQLYAVGNFIQVNELVRRVLDQ